MKISLKVFIGLLLMFLLSFPAMVFGFVWVMIRAGFVTGIELAGNFFDFTLGEWL